MPTYAAVGRSGRTILTLASSQLRFVFEVDFLARAWRVANDKARELGWISLPNHHDRLRVEHHDGGPKEPFGDGDPDLLLSGI